MLHPRNHRRRRRLRLLDLHRSHPSPLRFRHCQVKFPINYRQLLAFAHFPSIISRLLFHLVIFANQRPQELLFIERISRRSL